MPLKTPAFWYRSADHPAPLAEIALTPLSFLYDAGRILKASLIKEQKVDIPVLCVGNIVSGGSGKTPVVTALRDFFCTSGLAKNPVVLSRGYGGTLAGPLLVEQNKHTHAEVGDEPLLLARGGPVVVSRNRPAGARFAQNTGGDLILMDDGFQNPSLKKDLSLLVIDGTSGLGNNKLLPAGPLREPLQDALSRTDAVILIGNDAQGMAKIVPASIPVFSASIKPRHIPDPVKNYIGFAGLGRPEKFKRTLEECGLKLAAFHAFPDHHPFSIAEVQKLTQEAKKCDAVLITTEKDGVRLPEGSKSQIQTLPVALEWDDPERITDFLLKAIKDISGEKAKTP